MARGTRISFWLALLLSLTWAARSWAALGAPALKARVNDTAGILSTGTRQQLESMLAELERSDSTQIAVLTIPSLEGEVLEEFSLKVAEAWKIGQKGKDNGALLLIAKNDRKLRIETGYSLEGRLTDLQAGRIIRDVIRPKFHDGDFDGGTLAGVTAMIAAVRGEYQAESQAVRPHATPLKDYFVLGIFLFFNFFGLARVAGQHPKLSALLGGIIAPVVGSFFLGFQWLVLLALIGIGLVAGLLFALIFGRIRSSSGDGWVFSSGGSSSGDSGFSDSFGGGGGDFGGGGSSGDW